MSSSNLHLLWFTHWIIKISDFILQLYVYILFFYCPNDGKKVNSLPRTIKMTTNFSISSSQFVDISLKLENSEMYKWYVTWLLVVIYHCLHLFIFIWNKREAYIRLALIYVYTKLLTHKKHSSFYIKFRMIDWSFMLTSNVHWVCDLVSATGYLPRPKA